jgi:hypothetical protein
MGYRSLPPLFPSDRRIRSLQQLDPMSLVEIHRRPSPSR